MSRIIFDSGALIAFDRRDHRLWSDLKLAVFARDQIVVPSTALAQPWRGSSRQAMLSRALLLCSIVPFDPLAKEVGELCGRARTDDICDAHVALVASQADVLYTSDVGDLKHLLAHARGRTPAIFRC